MSNDEKTGPTYCPKCGAPDDGDLLAVAGARAGQEAAEADRLREELAEVTAELQTARDAGEFPEKAASELHAARDELAALKIDFEAVAKTNHALAAELTPFAALYEDDIAAIASVVSDFPIEAHTDVSVSISDIKKAWWVASEYGEAP